MEPADKPSVETDPDRESDRTKRHCFNCGKELIPASARYCPYCGMVQEQMPSELELPPAEVSLARRTVALNEAIAHFTGQGFRVVTKSQTSAQLMRPKQFSWAAAILSLLLLGIGFLIYLVYYLGQKDETIFLEVTPDGTILKDGHPFSRVVGVPPVKPPVERPSMEVEREEPREQISRPRRGPSRLVIGAVAGVPVVAGIVICIALALLQPERLLPSLAPSSYRTPTPQPTATPLPTSTPQPAVPVTPTPTGSLMSPTPIVYVVRSGDTLSGIAALHGTTAEAICVFNELTDCRLITPGQELMIPGEGVALPSPTKPLPAPSTTPLTTPTPSPPPTETPSLLAEGIMQVTTQYGHGTAWDVKVVSVEKETVLKSTFSDEVTYAAGEYWILTLEVINRGRRTDSFIVVDLALQPRTGGEVYEEDDIATLYVDAARDMWSAWSNIHPGEVGHAVKVFDVPVGGTELILMCQEILSRSKGTIVVRP